MAGTIAPRAWLTEDNTLTLWVTPTPREARQAFQFIARVVPGMDGVTYRAAAGQERITGPNGACVVFVAADSKGGRGVKAHRIVIDGTLDPDSLADALPCVAWQTDPEIIHTGGTA